MYYTRLIDRYLLEWSQSDGHKPLLLRGARQVGKSTAIRNLGERFESFVEINFEKNPEYKELFVKNLEVKRIVAELAAIIGKAITPGKTLLFLDEIQECPQAIMALRFFKEDLSELHVVAAGSLLEIALEDLPTFGVGRLHSMFMYPMTFDEFALACGQGLLLEARDNADAAHPLPDLLHDRLQNLMRNYMMIGGMPEAVAKWVETNDYLKCQEIQDDIIVGYEADFPKYKKKVDPQLLLRVFRAVAVQTTKKFNYSIGEGYRTPEVQKAVGLLKLAGLITPVTLTSANGLPLGSEENTDFQKMLLLDTGLMLRLLSMATGDISAITAEILTGSVSDLVNKGPLAEMIAGLEMLRYKSPNIRHELYYWQRMARNSQAEVDYVSSWKGLVLPIEVKAKTQGKMKSLWIFMNAKKLDLGIRCSLENFGEFDYNDATATDTPTRHIILCPLYALSRLPNLLQNYCQADIGKC